MIIQITSDLHAGIVKQQFIDLHLKMAKDSTNPDILIVAGDIGECINGTKLFEKCIASLTELFKTVLVIPGNHDLWTIDGNSLDIFNNVLPKICRDYGAFWLEDENFVTGNLAIVGSYLHYDYSAIRIIPAVKHLPKEFFIVHKKSIINDGRYLKINDVGFANKIGEQFKNRLLTAQNDDKIKHIIVVTHVPCIETQLEVKSDYNYSLGTVFFANVTYQDTILGCSKVSHVVSGHTHVGRRASIPKDGGEIEVVCLDSDYGKFGSYTINI